MSASSGDRINLGREISDNREPGKTLEDDEVRRIASTLASLSSQLSNAVCPENPPRPRNTSLQAETVRAAIRVRRLRSRYFTGDLFADPAWDMMLELLLAELMQVRVSVSDLCNAAAVPSTTALRWHKLMVDRGFFVRRPDQRDLRKVFVELSPDTSDALRCYFADIDAAANGCQAI